MENKDNWEAIIEKLKIRPENKRKEDFQLREEIQEN